MIFPSFTHFSKWDPFFLFGNIAQERLTESCLYLILRAEKYFRVSLVSGALIAWNSLFYRHSGSFFFNGVSNYSEQINNNNCIFLSRRSKPRWPRWIHEPAICIRQIKDINFCNVSFEKRKGIPFDELSWFMTPFTRHGESNLARIERRSANLIDIGEQNMDLYGAPFVNLLFRPNLCHFPLIYK